MLPGESRPGKTVSEARALIMWLRISSCSEKNFVKKKTLRKIDHSETIGDPVLVVDFVELNHFLFDASLTQLLEEEPLPRI